MSTEAHETDPLLIEVSWDRIKRLHSAVLITDEFGGSPNAVLQSGVSLYSSDKVANPSSIEPYAQFFEQSYAFLTHQLNNRLLPETNQPLGVLRGMISHAGNLLPQPVDLLEFQVRNPSNRTNYKKALDFMVRDLRSSYASANIWINYAHNLLMRPHPALEYRLVKPKPMWGSFIDSMGFEIDLRWLSQTIDPKGRFLEINHMINELDDTLLLIRKLRYSPRSWT